MRRQAGAARPFFYSDFIVSLDGRISWVNPRTGLREVPAALGNPADMRLFAELSAQADCLLTTARHLRAVAEGRHAGLLTLEGHDDLVAWRVGQGLPARPQVAAVSHRLDLPAAALRRHYSGPLTLICDPRPPPAQVAALTGHGIAVLEAPAPVDGSVLAELLARRGHRLVFSIAGPRVLRLLLEGDLLDRLYLTRPALFIGGEEFDTLLAGPHPARPYALPLTELYLDESAPEGAGQLFAVHARGSARSEHNG